MQEIELPPGAGRDRLHIRHELTQLRQRDTNGTTRRMEQNRLSAFQTAELEEKYIGCQVAVAQSGRLPVRHLVRYLVDQIAVDDQVLGPAAEAGQADDALAYAVACRVGSELDYFARALEARHEGKLRNVRVVALSHWQVLEVDATVNAGQKNV